MQMVVQQPACAMAIATCVEHKSLTSKLSTANQTLSVTRTGQCANVHFSSETSMYDTCCLRHSLAAGLAVNMSNQKRTFESLISVKRLQRLKAFQCSRHTQLPQPLGSRVHVPSTFMQFDQGTNTMPAAAGPTKRCHSASCLLNCLRVS